VGAAEHGFNNVVAQLKVVNLVVELCVEGIHFLEFIKKWDDCISSC